MLAVLFRLVLTFALLYSVYGGIMYTQERTLLFPGADHTPRPWHGALPATAELAEAPASFGRARWLLLRAPAATGRAPAIIFMHGNFETVERMHTTLVPTRDLGVHVLLLEYPGYAGADGAPSLDSINEAAERAYDWLVARADVDPQRIAVMGVSIGGGPAGELSRRRPVQALILLSTFTSLADFANAYGLPGWLARDPYDSVQRLRDFDGAVLVAHGRRDEIIPYRSGQQLAAAAHDPLFLSFDCGHNDCPYRTSAFAQTVGGFLRGHGLLDAPAVEAARAR